MSNHTHTEQVFQDAFYDLQKPLHRVSSAVGEARAIMETIEDMDLDPDCTLVYNATQWLNANGRNAFRVAQRRDRTAEEKTRLTQVYLGETVYAGRKA